MPFIPASGVEPVRTARGLCVHRCYAAQLDDRTAVARAAILVERSTGPLLLLSGQDDHVWPSARMGEMLVARMACHCRSDAIGHVSYPGAGHVLLSPPAHPEPQPAPDLDMGGDPFADATARTDGWRRITAFRARAFATGR